MLITINHEVTSAKDKLDYLLMLDREGLCWATGKPLLHATKHEPKWVNVYLEYNQGCAKRKVTYVAHEPSSIIMKVQNHDDVREIIKRFHKEINCSYDPEIVEKHLLDMYRELMQKYN